MTATRGTSKYSAGDVRFGLGRMLCPSGSHKYSWQPDGVFGGIPLALRLTALSEVISAKTQLGGRGSGAGCRDTP